MRGGGLQRHARETGQHVGPDDAYLALRGLRTMGVRLRQHETNGHEVAAWLDARDEVGTLLHPAFASCPGHEIWARDFTGASGLFAFTLRGASAAQRDRFVDALTRFGLGYSWGGFESLALPVDPVRTALPRRFRRAARPAAYRPRKSRRPDRRPCARVRVA